MKKHTIKIILEMTVSVLEDEGFKKDKFESTPVEEFAEYVAGELTDMHGQEGASFIPLTCGTWETTDVEE